MNHGLRGLDLCQKLRGLLAVLVGELLKVHIVQKTAQRPEIGFLAVAQLPGIPVHDTFYSEGVEDMEGFFVVLHQQIQCLLSCDVHKHPS